MKQIPNPRYTHPGWYVGHKDPASLALDAIRHPLYDIFMPLINTQVYSSFFR